MVRRIIIGEILNLIKGLGGNPNKFMGTKTNINFLGKGPQENLFQGQIDVEGMMRSGFPLQKVISEAESAGGYVTAGKLNELQLQRLKDNLIQLKRAYKPEQIANITDITTGTGDLTQEGLGSLRGAPIQKERTFADALAGAELVKTGETGLMNRLSGRMKNIKNETEQASGIMETIPKVDLPGKTASSREFLLNALKEGEEAGRVTFRDMVSAQDLKFITEGGGGVEGNPTVLIQKYFGPRVAEMMPVEATAEEMTVLTKRVLDNVVDAKGLRPNHPEFDPLTARIPDDFSFADGGMAHILNMNTGGRVGFKYGSRTIAKGALAFLNKNKKNAEYMFKASDNVSPGYTKGDMKYNAELLAEQLAEDAGVVYDDLADLDRIKFYGTAYDYLAKEMGMFRQFQNMTKNFGEQQILRDWNPPKGRKPNASGGLAKILEV